MVLAVILKRFIVKPYFRAEELPLFNTEVHERIQEDSVDSYRAEGISGDWSVEAVLIYFFLSVAVL